MSCCSLTASKNLFCAQARGKTFFPAGRMRHGLCQLSEFPFRRDECCSWPGFRFSLRIKYPSKKNVSQPWDQEQMSYEPCRRLKTSHQLIQANLKIQHSLKECIHHPWQFTLETLERTAQWVWFCSRLIKRGTGQLLHHTLLTLSLWTPVTARLKYFMVKLQSGMPWAVRKR